MTDGVNSSSRAPRPPTAERPSTAGRAAPAPKPPDDPPVPDAAVRSALFEVGYIAGPGLHILPTRAEFDTLAELARDRPFSLGPTVPQPEGAEATIARAKEIVHPYLDWRFAHSAAGTPRGVDGIRLQDRTRRGQWHGTEVVPDLWVGTTPQAGMVETMGAQGKRVLLVELNDLRQFRRDQIEEVDQVLHVPRGDERLSPEDVVRVIEAALAIVEWLKNPNHVVAVTCQLGQSRSVDLLAMVLKLMGYRGAEAIEHLRAVRGGISADGEVLPGRISSVMLGPVAEKNERFLVHGLLEEEHAPTAEDEAAIRTLSDLIKGGWSVGNRGKGCYPATILVKRAEHLIAEAEADLAGGAAQQLHLEQEIERLKSSGKTDDETLDTIEDLARRLKQLPDLPEKIARWKPALAHLKASMGDHFKVPAREAIYRIPFSVVAAYERLGFSFVDTYSMDLPVYALVSSVGAAMARDAGDNAQLRGEIKRAVDVIENYLKSDAHALLRQYQRDYAQAFPELATPAATTARPAPTRGRTKKMPRARRTQG